MSILFFDGMCVLCNRAAQWIAKHNPSGTLYFASLQGDYARDNLSDDLNKGETLVLIEDGRSFVRSEAIFRVLKYLPAWRWLRIFRFVPRNLTDRVYDWVAKNRFRWFGTQDECTVPPPAFRERFINS